MATDRDARVQEVLHIDPTPEYPRNSEGDIIALRDGRLMLAYTRFTGGPSDEAGADIAARFSSDEGLSWSDDVLLLPREGKLNSMSVSLLRLSSGALAIFYLVKNSVTDCRLAMRVAEEEGRSWSAPLWVTADPGYHVVNNARVIQLPSGRLLAPAALHEWELVNGEKHGPAAAMCYLSDDLGATWRRSRTMLPAPPQSTYGLQEPGVIRLTSGELLMLCRTDVGEHYRSYSRDEGETWSPAEPSGLTSPLSPATLRRLPSGELLLIWNDHSRAPAELAGKRTPLVTAISRDEGGTWVNRKVLENDPEGWYCYTSCTFVGKHALLAYCAGGPGIGTLNRLRVVRVRTDWFCD